MWRSEHLPFQVEFFHRGFFYKDKIDIFVEAKHDRATPIKYQRSEFSFGAGLPQWPDDDLGFAGFRIHAPINRSDYYDEICVFLGASYFRAVAKGEVYGLSARGLSINTGDPKGEEFPLFKAFWLEKPAPNATSMVVHALLDSKSSAGSYKSIQVKVGIQSSSSTPKYPPPLSLGCPASPFHRISCTLQEI